MIVSNHLCSGIEAYKRSMKETREHILANEDPKKLLLYGSSRSKTSDRSIMSLTSEGSGESEGPLKRSFKEKKTFG